MTTRIVDERSLVLAVLCCQERLACLACLLALEARALDASARLSLLGDHHAHELAGRLDVVVGSMASRRVRAIVTQTATRTTFELASHPTGRAAPQKTWVPDPADCVLSRS